MKIDEPCEIQDLWQEFNPSEACRGLFAYEGNATAGIKSKLQSIRAQEPNLKQFWIFVGSEGGFSQTEVELFQSKGLGSVTLGDQVLRVETACIALLAVLKYEFGHMAAHVGEK